jgi:prephenate dehydratase
MVFPGISMENLKFVSSHPMALLQCKNFLMKYPHITLVEEKDTADVAKQISEKKIKNTAAIASIEAAEIFGLEIISSNIQTIKNNETRFVIVSKELSKNENLIDKASLKFSLSHETGSLASVLSILKDYNLNLTKIQSLPIVEIPWKYSFFVDTTFSSIENFNDAIDLIKNEAESLKVLGLYKNQMK